METVVIIGGGASGIMAALTAAEDKQRRVILLERQQRIGKKLMATGNGRCNLTNTGAAPENYHGEHPEFVIPAMQKFTSADAIKYFEALGLMVTEEYGGRVYPLSNSANSVVDVLRFALEAAGVELRCSTTVREIRRENDGYRVITETDKLFASKLIVACGGAAGAKLGGVMDGYELLKPLGHKRTAIYPALVQLLTDTDYPRALKGVRADAGLTLLAGREELKHSAGEVQFTETGISGPAAFDISREVSAGGQGLTVSIDLFRDYDMDALTAWLKKRCEALPGLECAELFTGMLHNRLGRMMVKYAGLEAGRAIGTLSADELSRAAYSTKNFRMKLKGTESFDHAQVTAGGIKTTGFDPETLESWFMPGLFVCGELLDIDGDCGGYNLQWAWASGRLAGRLGR